jgi:hypothetical protein
MFVMYSPSEDVVFTLLDKKRLQEACGAVDIDVPATLPAGEIGRVTRYPQLVKPRTQVHLTSGIKGFIANEAESLAAEARRFRDLVASDPVLTARHPDVVEPMLQEYLRPPVLLGGDQARRAPRACLRYHRSSTAGGSRGCVRGWWRRVNAITALAWAAT